ncbi:MAG: HYR domain-containing protein [Haliscomenobacteraceae bacterium CHB4]|nr:HYR domain-containing protein [Haliscomenobacteraceae bacterium CHB4]
MDLDASTAGTYTVTYTIAAAGGCPEVTATTSITVNALPVVDLDLGFDIAYVNGFPVPLTGGTPAGGTFSGPGVSGSIFNPTVAGLGTHVITYTYTDGNGCTNSDTNHVTVITVPVFVLSVNAPDTAQCNEDVDVQIVVEDGLSNIGSIQFSLFWDSTKFDFVNAVPVDLDGEPPLLNTNITSSGRLAYSWLAVDANGATESTPPDFTLLTLTLTPKGCSTEGGIAIVDTPLVTEVANVSNLFIPVPIALSNDTLVFQDTIKPVVTCPMDTIVSADPALCTAVVSFMATATDNCDTMPVITYSPASGSVFPLGESVVTASATDDCGNTGTCTFTVTVIDVTPPGFDCSLLDTIKLTTEAPLCSNDSIVPVPVGVDNCGSTVTTTGTRSDNAAMTDPWPLGITTITWTFTDSTGNDSVCTQVVLVTDDDNPIVDCVSLVEILLGTDAGVCTSDSNIVIPNAFDNCSGLVPGDGVRSDALPLNDPWPIGSTTVTWTFADSTGNDTTCTQTVTVSDDDAPAFDCSTLLTVNLTTESPFCSNDTIFTPPVATDNCSGPITAVGTRPDTNIFNAPWPLGTTTITWTFTDGAGNDSICTQNIIVTDDDAPIVDCFAFDSVFLETGALNCLSDSNLTIPQAFDNCDGLITANAVRSDALPLDDPWPLGETTITLTYTDLANNSTVCTAVVIVADSIDPVITCPNDTIVSTDPGLCTAVVSFTATATDNCDANPAITYNPASGSVFPVGPTTVTATATDASGNSAECTFIVTVEDNEAPAVDCSLITTVNLTTDATVCSSDSNLVAPTILDNCGGTITATGTRSDAAVIDAPWPLGTTTITWTFDDGNGNDTTCTQDVIVVDDDLPVIVCPASPDTVTADDSDCDFTVTGTAYDPTVSDNCGVSQTKYAFVSGAGVSPTSGTTLAGAVFTEGSTVVRWYVEDVNGLVDSCDFTLVVDSCRRISGKLIWQGNGADGVGMADVNLTGDANATFTPTLADGLYELVVTSGSDFTVTPEKLINIGNGLTIADRTAIQQHLVGMTPITDPYRLVAADVNASYTITTVDAAIILQYLLGNSSAEAVLLLTKSWRFIPTDYVFPFAGPFTLPLFPQTRELTGVTGNTGGQDFFGVKTGDVKEDAGGTADPTMKPGDLATGDPLIWTLQDRVLQAGEAVAVDFTVSNFNDIAAYQFAVQFDPAHLQFDHIETTGNLPTLNADGHFGLYNIAGGEIRAVWNKTQGETLANGLTVFRIHFIAQQSGLKLSEVLSLDEKVLPEVAYNSILEARPLELVYLPVEVVTGTNDPAQAGVHLLQNRPNPFSDRTAITFVLPEACEAELRVYDVSGRLLQSYRAEYAAGTHQVTFELPAATATGLMYYELITPFGKLSKKMMANGR